MAERSKALSLSQEIFPFILCSSSLTSAKFYYFFLKADWSNFSRGARVQIPAGNAHFSAAFSSHATYVRGSLWGSWIPPGGWGVAESGGNRLKLRNRLKLFSKKSFKIESFEFPSLELKNIFSGVYPHQTHAPYTPSIPPNVKGHIGPSFPQDDKLRQHL